MFHAYSSIAIGNRERFLTAVTLLLSDLRYQLLSAEPEKFNLLYIYIVSPIKIW